MPSRSSDSFDSIGLEEFFWNPNLPRRAPWAVKWRQFKRAGEKCRTFGLSWFSSEAGANRSASQFFRKTRKAVNSFYHFTVLPKKWRVVATGLASHIVGKPVKPFYRSTVNGFTVLR